MMTLRRLRFGATRRLLVTYLTLLQLAFSFQMSARHLHHRRAIFPTNFPSATRVAQPLGAKLGNGHEESNSTPTATADGIASIPNLTVSLVKSIVGSGVLALPAGVATLGDSPRVILPAILLIIVIGCINAYFFSLIGRVCSITGATTYRQAWEASVGEDTSQYVAVTVALKTALTCLAFSIIVADSFQSLAIAAGLQDVTRVEALVVVTAFALLPLCLLKNLTSLAPFSFLGLVGMAFTTCVMVLRFLDGSYALDSDSLFLSQVPVDLQPSFGDSGPSLSGVVLACTLATAFVAHYNSPRFHSELQDNTIIRFDTVVGLAFFISAIVFSIVAVTGFLTFGSSSSGLILNNYSPYDPLVTASRAAVALSIVFTYPLVFIGFRDGVLDVLQLEEPSENVLTAITIGLLASITLAAANVTDLALVLSVGGGTFSTAVASVFPALMFRSISEKDGSNDDATLAMIFMALSVAVGLTGVSIAISNAIQ